MMRLYSSIHILAVALLLNTSTPAQAQDEATNARDSCVTGNLEAGLAFYGAKRTCIDSTDFLGTRCFYTYTPDCAGEDSPLVFDIHGYSSCPFEAAFYTGWRQLAQEHCFVLIWPLGMTDPTVADVSCWGLAGGLLNDDGSKFARPCCCHKGNIPVVTDATAFLRQVAAVAVRDIPEATSNSTTIDTKRIYMAGHSNGCMSSISMATTNSDMVAAVGCHAGRALTLFPDEYIATPMAFVHGTADPIVPFDGADFQFGAPETLSIISDKNGCTASTETRFEGFEGASNNFTAYTSTNCTGDADVTLYALDDVGHLPYYIASQNDFIESGTAKIEFDTTKLMWDFVQKYSLDVEPELVVRPATMPPSIAPSMMPTISASMRASVGPTLASVSMVAATLLATI